MYKGNLVYLRLFEPNDYEKTYYWHNDYELMKTTCGPFRFVSKEIEKNWTTAKSLENNREMYLAICLIENDKMIGWYSISNIDFRNRSCYCSGVVVGDKNYKDGDAFFEAGDLAFRFIMDELNMNRITGSCLAENFISRALMEASLWKLEGIEREGIYKGGKYHDICHYSILRREHEYYIKNGDYNHFAKRFLQILKSYKI